MFSCGSICSRNKCFVSPFVETNKAVVTSISRRVVWADYMLVTVGFPRFWRWSRHLARPSRDKRCCSRRTVVGRRKHLYRPLLHLPGRHRFWWQRFSITAFGIRRRWYNRWQVSIRCALQLLLRTWCQILACIPLHSSKDNNPAVSDQPSTVSQSHFVNFHLFKQLRLSSTLVQCPHIPRPEFCWLFCIEDRTPYRLLYVLMVWI